MPRWRDILGRDHTDAETPSEPELHPELQKVMDRVGKDNYARATAREFRPGGKFNPKPRRQKYAIT